MTTTDTMDTLATIEQSVRMIDAGSEYVRITAPSIKEAQNLLEIKKGLRQRGYTTPLIADIHFTPNAAELAARIVEKVRVNPGNYADRKNLNLLITPMLLMWLNWTGSGNDFVKIPRMAPLCVLVPIMAP